MIVRRVLTLLLLASLAVADARAQDLVWQEVTCKNEPHKRHESAFVQVGDRYYAVGGRGMKPVDIFDPETRTWSEGRATPIELHHFQAVAHDGLIYVLGALSGPWPFETPSSHIYIYDPVTDVWTVGPEVPAHRRRGAAGVAVHGGKIYVVAGIVNGHTSHWVPWLDEFDPATNSWRELPDAPHARDHFHAAIIDGKLYAAGGRRSGSAEDGFSGAVRAVDVYEFDGGKWSTLPSTGDIPTARAGTAVFTLGDELVVLGGESGSQELAHSEVEALDVRTGTWRSLPPLLTGRHATQAIQNARGVFVVAGCARRGGSPEITAFEQIALGDPEAPVGEPVARGRLEIVRQESLAPGLVEVSIRNAGGNQGLVIAHALAVGAEPVEFARGFPYVLAPGAEVSMRVRFDGQRGGVSSLLIKTVDRDAPLEVALVP